MLSSREGLWDWHKTDGGWGEGKTGRGEQAWKWFRSRRGWRWQKWLLLHPIYPLHAWSTWVYSDMFLWLSWSRSRSRSKLIWVSGAWHEGTDVLLILKLPSWPCGIQGIQTYQGMYNQVRLGCMYPRENSLPLLQVLSLHPHTNYIETVQISRKPISRFVQVVDIGLKTPAVLCQWLPGKQNK